MSGGGSGHIDYGRSGGARAGAIGGAPRVTADLGDGQWPGVCGPGSGCVGLRTRREAALHRTGEAGPECVHREHQRQDAGRMRERALVHEFGRSSGYDRSLEEGLQRGSAPYFVGESDPARIHSARCSSAVAYGSLRAAPKRRAKANNYPRTRIMIGTENGGRSGRVDETEAVELPLFHQVQGNLTRGIEIVAAKIHLEPERLIIAKFPRGVGVYIVTLVAQRVQERSVGA